MHYSLFIGGKRLRPILCLTAASAVGGNPELALPAACAIECVHTYSLIHDDLPCMDDDDLRRGQPTSHKVFGEAVAVLAGDALLTQAFEIIAQTIPTRQYGIGDFVRELAIAAGSRKMIAGQVADMEAEGKPTSRDTLRFIHRGKTAAMLAVSLRLGAMAVDASLAQVAALEDFGMKLGLAFQVQDDILDVTQPSETLGKSAGKDIAAGKATYPALLGLEGARKEAARLTQQAIAALCPLGSSATTLRTLADYLLTRNF